MKSHSIFWTVFCLLCPVTLLAQTGIRYAETVFESTMTTSEIPFSSAVREGQTSPTTLCLVTLLIIKII